MPIYELSENNSGGSFWLNRDNYEALFRDGWYIEDKEPSKFSLGEDFGRYDGTRYTEVKNEEGVPYSWRHSLRVEASSMQEAVERFESATGEDFFAEGCNCCGAPFSMSSVDADEWKYLSGDSVTRTVNRPW